jgi:uncharacterized protein (DUF2164 family)
MPKRNHPMRIEPSDDRRERMIGSLRQFFSDKLDLEVSEYQAQLILDFFLRELGAPVYNQAIRDAYAFVADKLEDLEGEFYEPEEPYSGG